jgi:alpha-tubulin suppressor-like RCC1 family protein
VSVCLAAGIIAGCDDASTGAGRPISFLIITPRIDSVEPGGVRQYSVEGVATNPGPRVPVQSATWQSSDPAVASVSQAGLVTGHSVGTATIRATSGTLTATASIRVQATVAGVVITTPAPELDVHDTPVNLTAAAIDADGHALSGRKITWTSTNAGVVAVTGGVVSPVGVGIAAVVARAGAHEARLPVTVRRFDVAALRLVPTEFHMFEGQQADAAAVVEREDGRQLLQRDRAWSATTPTVATVQADGRVTAVALGTGEIAVVVEGVTATASITVRSTESAAVVAAGESHSCAIAVSGRLWCWGANYLGQLGSEGNSGCAWWEYYYFGVSCDFNPLEAKATASFISVVAGAQHTCGSITSGQTLCWGLGTSGQLGRGSRQSSTQPVLVDIGTQLISLTGGDAHTCGIAVNGSAWCWGANNDGQLGTGDSMDRTRPTPVAGNHTFVSIEAGAAHTCAIAVDAAIFCWGANAGGQLGIGTTGASVHEPAPVAGSLSAQAIVLGQDHTCALTTNGAIQCWGDNRHGELGTGNFVDVSVPASLASSGPWQALTARGHATCAVATGGQPHCWGDIGALFVSNAQSQNIPVPVTTSVPFVRIRMGLAHACGMSVSWVVACWGSGYNGELGIAFFSSTPVLLAGLP